MGQEERIQKAYRGLGGKRTFYDGMITCSTLPGRAVCSLVWEMGRAETQDYLCAALSGIPEGFSGRLLEVPVGTGILTMPLYREMPEAEITCLDYSPEMLERAKSRGEGLAHVCFQQGDVGALPFGDGSFDIVLSLNGFHAFPDNVMGADMHKLLLESLRVLKKGGVFALNDDMKPKLYGDMDAFAQKLREMGYQDVRLIDTAEEAFGSHRRAAMMMLGSSQLLVGRK